MSPPGGQKILFRVYTDSEDLSSRPEKSLREINMKHLQVPENIELKCGKHMDSNRRRAENRLWAAPIVTLVRSQEFAALLTAGWRRVRVHVALQAGERGELAPADWTLIVPVG